MAAGSYDPPSFDLTDFNPNKRFCSKVLKEQMKRVGDVCVGRCQKVNIVPDRTLDIGNISRRWKKINPDRSLYVAMVTRLPGEYLSMWKRIFF